MATKTLKAGKPVRPAPVSLHPLSLEQALGALVRTPNQGTTKEAAPAAVKEAKPKKRA